MDLTKITTPFGLLDKETQEALKAHGGPYQYFDGGGWASFSTEPNWHTWISYRVKPQPLTKPSIDWSHVAKEYKWMARDRDGTCFVYCVKPEKASVSWVTEWSYCSVKCFASYTPGTCDWRDSLVERPES